MIDFRHQPITAGDESCMKEYKFIPDLSYSNSAIGFMDITALAEVWHLLDKVQYREQVLQKKKKTCRSSIRLPNKE